MPVSVEAKTGDATNLKSDSLPVDTVSAKVTPPSTGPEAYDRLRSGNQVASRHDLAYRLEEPVYEAPAEQAVVAKVDTPASTPSPERPAVYSSSAYDPDEGRAGQTFLAEPDIAPEKKPDALADGMAAPASGRAPSVASLPGAELPASLKIAESEAKPEAISMPGVTKAGRGDANASLAMPGVTDTGTGLPVTDERISMNPASAAGGTGVSLALPELSEELTGQAVAEERIAMTPGASYRDGVASLGLPSLPEVKSETASVDERLAVAREAGKAANDIALADPLVPEAKSETASVDERLAVARESGKTDMVAALNDPELPAAESADVDVRLGLGTGDARPLGTVALADPDASVELVETANRPPETLALAKPGDKPAVEVAVAEVPLADPDVTIEKAAEEKPDIAVATRANPSTGKPEVAFLQDVPRVVEASAVREATEEEKNALAALDAAKKRIAELERNANLNAGTVPEKGAESPAGAAALLEGVARIDAFDKKFLYIQLGVYKSATGAKKAIMAMEKEYPLAYQIDISRGTPMYRLFVGPLRKDESGVVLRHVKVSGYKDAFIRKGE